jgi:hypothetical protein
MHYFKKKYNARNPKTTIIKATYCYFLFIIIIYYFIEFVQIYHLTLVLFIIMQQPATKAPERKPQSHIETNSNNKYFVKINSKRKSYSLVLVAGGTNIGRGQQSTLIDKNNEHRLFNSLNCYY